MKIFMTGGSGWIGRHVLPLLIANGHTVSSLVRSDEGAERVKSLGGTPIRGDLTDLDLLESSAKGCQAAIHLGYIHDFTSPEHDSQRNARVDKEVFHALAKGLGPGGILINSSGVLGAQMRTGGKILTEDVTKQSDFRPDYVEELRGQGLKAFAVRLSPTIHGQGDQGFITLLGMMARKAGAAMVVGDGAARWPACHVTDAAKIYAGIIEKADTLPHMFYHGVAEEGIPTKEIAAALGKRLDLPVKFVTQEEAAQTMGMFSRFVAMDGWSSNEITRKELDWNPTGPTLLEDIANAPSYGGDTGKYA